MIEVQKADMTESERHFVAMATRTLHWHLGAHPVKIYEDEGRLVAVHTAANKLVLGPWRSKAEGLFR